MSKSLVVLTHNEPMTTSLVIAKETETEHASIILLIRKHQSDLDEFGTCRFEIAKSKGRPTEYAILNEEQTTLLITYMKNTEIVRKCKKKLVREFFRLRKALNAITVRRQNEQWLEQRQNGKLTRKAETDVIKEFVEYAKAQGSQSADQYYRNISKMENSALFFIEQKFPNLRDVLTNDQLNWVQTADVIIAKALKDGMTQGLHYKDIYKLAKASIEKFASVIPKSPVPHHGDTTALLAQAM